MREERKGVGVLKGWEAGQIGEVLHQILIYTLPQVEKRLKRESQERSGLERWDVWTLFRDPCFEAVQSSSRSLTNRKQGMT